MELAQLIQALSDPAAYPDPVEKVEVRQTHISVVFLVGRHVYKVKKPVNLGFLDFSTLEKRRHFCEEEVRLNRRLAPRVYLGVVPLTLAGTTVAVEGQGEVIDWAVKMERLPQQTTLLERLRQEEIGVKQVEALAQKLAAFHTSADAGEHVATFGQFPVVAANCGENFDQAVSQVGITITEAVFNRLRALTESNLTRLQPLIDRRAADGMTRDTHGDLRLDHVYLFPDQKPPNDLVIIDCIEFNERFRHADPVADMAFLVMDLKYHSRRDLAQSFADAYFSAASDESGRQLLPFYTGYRASVRAKVEGFQLREPEIPQTERHQALTQSRAHWLLALGELEQPSRRPALVLVGGLPGTGKSTLARDIAQQANLHLLRSDLVRKELAGLSPAQSARAGFGEGLYTPAWTDRTYSECVDRVEKLLLAGQRVVVDASFGEERRRRAFLELAATLAVPALFFLCQADPEVVRLRLNQRHGDASDADWRIHQQAAERFEEVGQLTQPALRTIHTGGTPQEIHTDAIAVLREAGLLD